MRQYLVTRMRKAAELEAPHKGLTAVGDEAEYRLNISLARKQGCTIELPTIHRQPYTTTRIIGPASSEEVRTISGSDL